MIRLVGDITDASTHFAQVGLALILQNAGVKNVRIFWEDGSSARAVVTWDGDTDVGQIVKDHAARCCQEGSWVSQSVIEASGKKPVEAGVFSPRVTPRKTVEDLAKWVTLRRTNIDALPLDRLDMAMVGELGEPAYWHVSHKVAAKDVEPDRGATRWEMTIRLSGRNFVPDALLKYAGKLADREPKDILDGLVGNSLNDDFGTGTTPLGFKNRSAMDTATAWCMLWGIAATTLVPRSLADIPSRGFAQSSGAYPRNRVHPRYATLPVMSKPTSVCRWSGVLRSKTWDEIVQTGDVEDLSPVVMSQLVSWGVENGVRFEIEVAGSASAPERRLNGGSVFRIADAWR